MQAVTVRFMVLANLVGIEWMPIEFAPLYNDKLIQHWLDGERLTCCDFQGGFEIDVDGKFWNDGCVDEFWMTMSWFYALEAFLNGETEREISVWEESRLVLKRDGDALTMYEVRHLPDTCQPVTVSFRELAAQMCSEGRVFAAWVRSLHDEVARRLPNSEVETLQKAIRDRLPETTEEKLAKITFEVQMSFVEQIERVCALLDAEFNA